MPALAPIRDRKRFGPRGRPLFRSGQNNPKPLFGGFTGVRIGGVDVTAYLKSRSPRIRSTAYAQTGVLSFTLESQLPCPALTGIIPEQEVNWNVGGVTYGGLVKIITPEDRWRTDYLVLNIECQDYTFLLSKDICAYSNAYTNPVRSTVETDAQRISWLLQSFDRFGISASHVQTLTPAASLPTQDFTGSTLTDAIKAVLAFGNGQFYVDTAKDLHTFTSETNLAPFALSDAPDGVTSFGYTDFAYPQDSVDLANAIYAIPGRGQPALADSGTDTITTTGGPPLGACITIVSLKPASNSAFARVGALGPFTVGSNTSVSPTFGQATSVGNLLVAWVDSASDNPTTTASGWVQVGTPNASFGFRLAIWAKPNCGTTETAPVFSAAAGTVPMTAQLGEFSGGLLVSPFDQTANFGWSGSAPTTLPIANSTLDATDGDLILMIARWALTAADVAPTFLQAFNNAAAVQASTGSDGTNTRWHSFSYGIVPTAARTWYSNEASIASYGRREASFTDTTVVTQAALDALGTAYLLAHATPLRHCSLKCLHSGLAAGMTVAVTNALYGISAQGFRIQGLDTSYPDDNAPQFDVQFADSAVTLATQLNALQGSIPTSGSTTTGTLVSTLGTVGYAQITVTQTGITVLTDVTGLTLTNTLTSGRRYRVKVYCGITSTVSTDTIGITLLDGVTSVGAAQVSLSGNNVQEPAFIDYIVVGDGLSHTFKVQAERGSGSGSVQVVATGSQFGMTWGPSYILIEDIGT